MDQFLSAQYEELLQKLTDFANGEPSRNTDALWDRESTYFRVVTAPVRKGWFSLKGTFTYGVMTAPGVTRFVGPDQLDEAVGHGPQHSRKDWQERQLVADRLFREGHKDDWVHYSSSYVVPDGTSRKVG